MKNQKIWVSNDLSRWEAYGSLLGANDSGASILVPLSDNSIFLAKRFGMHFLQEGYSPFYIVKSSDDGSLHASANVDLDIGPMYSKKAWTTKDGTDFDNLICNPRYQICKNMLFELPSTLFQFDDGFLFLSKQMGVAWCFDRTGRLKSRLQLFGLMVDDDFARIFTFERAIVNCQLTPDQTILVAARTKEAVWFNQHFFPSMPTSVEGDPVPPEVRALNEGRGNDLNPNLEWFELDPGKGRIRGIAPPFGAPTTIRELPESSAPWFTFARDGSARFRGRAEL